MLDTFIILSSEFRGDRRPLFSLTQLLPPTTTGRCYPADDITLCNHLLKLLNHFNSTQTNNYEMEMKYVIGNTQHKTHITLFQMA